MTQSAVEKIEGMVRGTPAEVAKAVIRAIENPNPKLR